MIVRVKLIAYAVALLSLVISAVDSEMVDMNKMVESVQEARRNANAKSEAARKTVLQSNEASNNYNIKQNIYFDAMRNKFALDAKKPMVDAEFVEADNDYKAKDKSFQEKPTDEDLKTAKDAAKIKLDEVKKRKKDLDEEIVIAINVVKTSEEQFVAAQNLAENLKKEASKLMNEATAAEAYAVQLETTMAATSLVSSMVPTPGPLPTSVTPNPIRPTLTPEEQLIIRMYLNKLKTETSTRRPTMIGNIVRAWAKVNLGIADSLDRMKASIRGVLRPNAIRNPMIN